MTPHLASDSLTQRLADSGLRSTPQREVVYSVLLRKRDHPTAEEVFARVKAVWDNRDAMDLTDEQQRVLMLTHRGFVRSGAQLEGPAAEKLRVAKSRLSVLGTDFVQNLLADEREWFMPLAADDLTGLPDFVVATAKAAGEEKDAGGPVVTLSRSLIVPFLQFSDRRDLRQKAYEAWGARGANGGKTDNRCSRNTHIHSIEGICNWPNIINR